MDLLSLETASFWSNVTVAILTVLAAIAGVSALYFSTRLGAMKDEELTRFQLESTERITVANSEAAKASARAAEANLKAEQEHHARVKIEQRLAPRIIEPDQRNRMIEVLKPLSGTKFIASVANGGEAYSLLITILDVFIQAGWVFSPWDSTSPKDTGYGLVGPSLVSAGVLIHIPSSLEEKVIVVTEAFRLSGLEVVRIDHQDHSGLLHIEVAEKGGIP